MVGLSVLAPDAAPVKQEGHRQVLHAYVMEHLVIAALKKAGVNRHIRSHSAGSKSCRHGRSVLFSDFHVDQPVGISFREMVQPGAEFHRRGNGDNAPVVIRHVGQRVRHNMPPGRLCRSIDSVACFDIERRRSVESFRTLFSLVVSVSFLCQYLDYARTFMLFRLQECLFHACQVVPVDRPEILKTECLEKA